MKYVIWIVLILVVAIRVLYSQPTYSNGQRLRITSTISLEPTVYSYQQRVTISGLKVYLPKYPEIYYGDKIVVEGVVKDGELTEPKLISVKPTDNFLIIFKRKIVSFWQRTLPEPDASLVAGIVLGYKSSLPRNFSDVLKKTGTTHVVVASGMNVTFTASFLMAILLKFTKRSKALIITLIGIVFYCVITGFEAPIVRAAIMAGITFAAQLTGRVSSSLRAAGITGLIMLAIKPAWIADIGFILSFASTISLMLFESKVSSKLHFVPGLFRESLSTSLAAQIGTAPILFATFGQFNILSPVINALVLWVVPIVMIIGAVGGVIGLISPFLGQIITYLLYPLTTWFIWTTQTFANI